MKPWEKYQSKPWERYSPTRDLKAENPSEYDPDSPEFQAKYGPAAVPAAENFDAGVGKAIFDIGQGVGQTLGLQSREDVKEKRALDAPLVDTTAGKVGQFVGSVLPAVGVAAIPGVNTAVGATVAGGAMGALAPSESTQETLKNTGLGAAFGFVGQKVGEKVAKWVGERLAARATRAAADKANNAVRDATLKASQEAGYVVPPSTTNPTVLNRALESVAGKAATQQSAQVANQGVTNNLIRQELGLPEGAPLTRGMLNGIRLQAGRAYQAVKSAGLITADSQYLDDLTRIAQSVDDVAKDFPDANVGANEEINKLVNSLLRDRFSSSSVVEFVKQLRKSATGNMSGVNAADPAKRALGMAQRDAASALEDQVIRHLESKGMGQLAQEFDAARVLIAKTYSAEAALNESTGNIVATKLSAHLRRGKPLSGGLETAAKFAGAFPKAAGEQVTSPGVSAVDALIGGVGAGTGNPAMLGLPLARMAARGTALSGPYQAAMTAPNYGPGLAGTSVLQSLLLGAKLAPAAGIGVPAYVGQQ